MSKVPRARVEPQFRANAVTIWIVREEETATTYSVWRGPRTVAALSELLGKLEACGFPATVEIESRACGPIEMTLPDLVNLGVITEACPAGVARRNLQRPRHLTLASVGEVLARPVVALARLARGSV